MHVDHGETETETFETLAEAEKWVWQKEADYDAWRASEGVDGETAIIRVWKLIRDEYGDEIDLDDCDYLLDPEIDSGTVTYCRITR